MTTIPPARKGTDEEDPARQTDLFQLLTASVFCVHLLLQQLLELLLLPPSGHSLPSQLSRQQGHLHLHLWRECKGWDPGAWIWGRRVEGSGVWV